MSYQTEAAQAVKDAQEHLTEAEDAIAALEDIDTDEIRDKLYDLTSTAESLAATVANLRNSDIQDIHSDINEAEGEADQLAQELRDWHSSI